jgi:hypothetical protein
MTICFYRRSICDLYCRVSVLLHSDHVRRTLLLRVNFLYRLSVFRECLLLVEVLYVVYTNFLHASCAVLLHRPQERFYCEERVVTYIIF